MSTRNDAHADWESCPSGSLAGFSTKEHLRQRRRFVAKVAGIASVLLLAGSSAYVTWEFIGLRTQDVGGVACYEVRANAVPYAQGRLKPQLMQRIRAHLERCEECRRLLPQLEPKRTGHAHHSVDLQTAESCGCDGCRDRLFLVPSGLRRSVVSLFAFDYPLVHQR